MIKIEKGVNVPPKAREIIKYPFLNMEVGDSFHISAKEQDLQTSYNRLNNAMSRHHKNTDMRFTLRNLKTEVRVWRIK